MIINNTSKVVPLVFLHPDSRATGHLQPTPYFLLIFSFFFLATFYFHDGPAFPLLWAALDNITLNLSSWSRRSSISILLLFGTRCAPVKLSTKSSFCVSKISSRYVLPGSSESGSISRHSNQCRSRWNELSSLILSLPLTFHMIWLNE